MEKKELFLFTTISTTGLEPAVIQPRDPRTVRSEYQTVQIETKFSKIWWSSFGQRSIGYGPLIPDSVNLNHMFQRLPEFRDR